jgi:hypothetical protein
MTSSPLEYELVPNKEVTFLNADEFCKLVYEFWAKKGFLGAEPRCDHLLAQLMCVEAVNVILTSIQECMLRDGAMIPVETGTLQ